MVRACAAAVAVLVVAVTGCQDPCVTLAQRICNCEPTVSDRRNCTLDRITNQQARIETSEADQAFCAAALDTCSCQALDENNLEACGFSPAASE